MKPPPVSIRSRYLTDTSSSAPQYRAVGTFDHWCACSIDECSSTLLSENPDLVCRVRQRLLDANTPNARKALVYHWLISGWEVRTSPSGKRSQTAPNNHKQLPITPKQRQQMPITPITPNTPKQPKATPTQTTSDDSIFRTSYGFQSSNQSVRMALCKSAFLELVVPFVTEGQVRRMIVKQKEGLDPLKDRRGGAFHTVSPGAFEALRDVVSASPRMERHYTLNTDRKNQVKQVLAPECTKKWIWDKFSDNASGACRRWVERSLNKLDYRRGQYCMDKCSTCTHQLSKMAKITPAQVQADTPAGRKAKEKLEKLEAKHQRHLTRAEEAKLLERAGREEALRQAVPNDSELPMLLDSVCGVMHLRLDMGSNVKTPWLSGGGPSHYNTKSYTCTLYIVDSSRGDKVYVCLFSFSFRSFSGFSFPFLFVPFFFHLIYHLSDRLLPLLMCCLSSCGITGDCLHVGTARGRKRAAKCYVCREALPRQVG